MVAAPKKKRVYFELDAPKAKDVRLCGSFNDWDPEAKQLKKNKEGRWRTFRMLPPGIYEYRFLVDGEWRNDGQGEQVPNPYGSQNSVRVVL
jgi:1,4-alpha-glucan branching enzyme